MSEREAPLSGQQTWNCQREASPPWAFLWERPWLQRPPWRGSPGHLALTRPALSLAQWPAHPTPIFWPQLPPPALVPRGSSVLLTLGYCCPERQEAGVPTCHVTARHSPLISMVSWAAKKDLNFILIWEKRTSALASVAWWVGAYPVDQKVRGLITSKGTYPGCGFNPQSGSVQKATNLFLSPIFFSL